VRGRRVLVAFVGAMIAGACFGRGHYACVNDTQCDLGAEGRCEGTGWCSYPDAECGSGRAYDAVAGAGLAGTCVEDETADGGSTSPSTSSSGSSGEASETGDATDTGGEPPCEDHDGDAHGVGPGCEGIDCDDDNSARHDGCMYLSPIGDDANPGTRDQPWRSFAHAIPELDPGDSLVLLDGEYTPESSGLLHVNCDEGGNGNSGLDEGMPISVRAESERRALLHDTDATGAVRLSGCAFWNLTGLAGQGEDLPSVTQSLFAIIDSSDIRARRLLFRHANRWTNSQVYIIQGSTRVRLEESEALDFHRTGITVYNAQDVTVSRCYVNALDAEDLEGASPERGTPYPSNPSDTGDTGISLALGGRGGHVVEDCIVEGPVGTGIHLGRGTDDLAIGNILIDPETGVFGGAAYDTPATGHRIEQLVVARATGHAITLRSATDFFVDGVTLVDGSNGGLVADEQSDLLCDTVGGCSHEARHVLSLRNAGPGITGIAPVEWWVSYSNAFGNDPDFGPDEPIDDDQGNVHHSLSVPADEIGLETGRCLVFVPAGSSMKGQGEDGADIGANVLYRHEDGALTDVPLWDPTTGAFPCGAVISGLNDDPGTSCSAVHQRLNVAQNGCALPAGYGQ
jgi:hypothetical protein